MTFGFQSAINIATDAIDCIHTTAASHNRVFIVEVMGHKVGWLTLYAGVAGGADIILLPEMPYDIDKVVDAIHKRTKEGKGFTILAVAEGAISKEDAALSKRNTRRSLQRANTHQYHTRLQTASAKDSVLRSEWQFRDIHSEAAAHALTTECFVHVLAQQQQRPSWMRITAA